MTPQETYENSSRYNLLRLAAVVVTLLCLVGHGYLPEKNRLLFPREGQSAGVYADSEWGGKSRARWVDETNHIWECDFQFSDVGATCGFAVYLADPLNDGIDFSNMQGLRLKLGYRGDSTTMRVFVRNFNPDFSNVDDVNSTKYMSVNIQASELYQEIYVDFSELSVIDWWITQYKIPRRFATPEFGNVISVGVDFFSPGHHELQMEKIEVTGKWISQKDLYLTVLLAWMALLLFEGVSRIYSLRKRLSAQQEDVTRLVGSNQQLQKEKHQLKIQSMTDALTGVYNRAGIEQWFKQWANQNANSTTLGIIILDVDHFKRVNDNRGHDVGDKVLQNIAHLISSSIRSADMFGRWGGEEFILLCHDTDDNKLLTLAEKLRKTVAQSTTGQRPPLRVTISIGAAMKRADDNLASLFKRADEALYQAKGSGRNCVVLSGHSSTSTSYLQSGKKTSYP